MKKVFSFTKYARKKLLNTKNIGVGLRMKLR